MSSPHARQVFTLYRRLLRLHQRLPPDFRAVGSEFVREEFRKHRTAEPQFVPQFMKEWTDFASALEEQLSSGNALGNALGTNISQQELDMLNDQQIGQLYELKREAKKPPN